MSNSKVYTKDCKHGPFMLFQGDLISSCMYTYGEWSERELRLLIEYLLKPGDNVIEVGSNIGSHSIPIAKRIGPEGKLYCFEPQQIPYQLLNGNLAINNILNTQTFRWVVSDKPGAVRLQDHQSLQEENLGCYFVPNNVVETGGNWTLINNLDMIIDNIVQKKVSLIKVDVEGMEERVLRGAQQSIQKYKPYIFVENNFCSKSTFWDHGDEFFRWIEALGYNCFWYCTRGFNPDNFFRNPVNKIGEGGDINMICVPSDKVLPLELQPFVGCNQIIEGLVNWVGGGIVKFTSS